NRLPHVIIGDSRWRTPGRGSEGPAKDRGDARILPLLVVNRREAQTAKAVSGDVAKPCEPHRLSRVALPRQRGDGLQVLVFLGDWMTGDRWRRHAVSCLSQS